MAFKIAFAPKNEIDLALIRSQLDDEKIRFSIQNEHFGGQYPGAKIPSFNQPYILIWDEDLERAKPILEQFQLSDTTPPPMSWLNRLRCWVEALCCGWFVPSKRD